MKKIALAAVLLLATLIPASAVAQVVVRVGPPPVIVERRPPRPGPRYVWISGYQRWTGRGYVWVPGHYVVAPRPRAVWVPHHWVHRGHTWVFVEGHWR